MKRKAWGVQAAPLRSLGDRKRREEDTEQNSLPLCRPLLPACATVSVMPNVSILPAHMGEGQKLYITPLVYTLRTVLGAAKYTLKQLSKRHIYIYQCVPHD